jgi:hypothetical protein
MLLLQKPNVPGGRWTDSPIRWLGVGWVSVISIETCDVAQRNSQAREMGSSTGIEWPALCAMLVTGNVSRLYICMTDRRKAADGAVGPGS